MEMFKANEAGGKLKKRNTPFGPWEPTKSFAPYFEVDEVRKKWIVFEGMLNNKITHIFDYSDVVDFKLVEDDESVTKGGLGSAVAGAAAFGGVGAIVGSITGKKTTRKVITNLSIKITTNVPDRQVVYIHFLKNTKTKTSSSIYVAYAQMADQILALLANMCNINVPEPQSPVNGSIADEIRKYKELLDEGAITPEEFEMKKRQLLDL